MHTQNAVDWQELLMDSLLFMIFSENYNICGDTIACLLLSSKFFEGAIIVLIYTWW